MDRAEFERRILDNLNIVRIIASKIHSRIPSGIELDDLIHTGILGLIDAVEKFDPTRGAKFTTYASLRIRGAILDELRNLDWASRSLRHKIKEVESAFEVLEMQLGRPPKEEEVADSLNLSIEEFHRLLDESRGVGVGVFRIELDEESNIADNGLVKYFIDEETGSPVLVMEKNEMRKSLARFIEELPDKEKLVLNLYYIDDLNLKEIGKIMELTESRISQIRTAALLRLRSKMAEIARKYRVTDREIL